MAQKSFQARFQRGWVKILYKYVGIIRLQESFHYSVSMLLATMVSCIGGFLGAFEILCYLQTTTRWLFYKRNFLSLHRRLKKYPIIQNFGKLYASTGISEGSVSISMCVWPVSLPTTAKFSSNYIITPLLSGVWF